MNPEQVYHLGIKAIIHNPRNEVLILKSANTKYASFSGGWDLPGGRVVQDENILDTLAREVHEETGITNLENIVHCGMRLTPIQIPLADNNNAGMILNYFRCSIANELPVQLSTEHSEFSWVPWEKARGILNLDI